MNRGWRGGEGMRFVEELVLVVLVVSRAGGEFESYFRGCWVLAGSCIISGLNSSNSVVF